MVTALTYLTRFSKRGHDHGLVDEEGGLHEVGLDHGRGQFVQETGHRPRTYHADILPLAQIAQKPEEYEMNITKTRINYP